MLHLLLKWKTYRTFKNGFLLDYFSKRIVYNISTYFFSTLAIFFGDKFFLEHLFTNLISFFTNITTQLKFFEKYSFFDIFKITLYITTYIIILITIIII